MNCQFQVKLRALRDIMFRGNLEEVKQYVDALSIQEMRPVIESAICIGFFKNGTSFEILSWMTTKIGTFEISRHDHGFMKLVRVKQAIKRTAK